MTDPDLENWEAWGSLVHVGSPHIENISYFPAGADPEPRATYYDWVRMPWLDPVPTAIVPTLLDYAPIPSGRTYEEIVGAFVPMPEVKCGYEYHPDGTEARLELLDLLVTDAIEHRGAPRQLFDELWVVLVDRDGKRRPADEIEAETRAGLERLREEAKR